MIVVLVLIVVAWLLIALPVSVAIGRAARAGDEYERVGELQRIGRALR